MPRGVRVWNQSESTDLFGVEPPPAPAPPAAAPLDAESTPTRRYTDRENRRLEKVLPMLLGWLQSAPIETLEAAETPALIVRFAPMQGWDIEQMVAGAIRNRRKAKR
jgi:hypothetical protein